MMILPLYWEPEVSCVVLEHTLHTCCAILKCVPINLSQPWSKRYTAGELITEGEARAGKKWNI